MITGRTRYRLGWRGKVVLQVSEWKRPPRVVWSPPYIPCIEVWRDATFRDVMDISEGKVTPDRPNSERGIPKPPPPKSDA